LIAERFNPVRIVALSSAPTLASAAPVLCKVSRRRLRYFALRRKADMDFIG